MKLETLSTLIRDGDRTRSCAILRLFRLVSIMHMLRRIRRIESKINSIKSIESMFLEFIANYLFFFFLMNMIYEYLL